MVSTIGILNSFRYRGYVYDTETELYYLQSRYSDAEVGRFINADGYISTGQGINGSNVFAYCGNNPVNFVDTGGTDASAIINDAWGTWTSTMWSLSFVDGPFPVGEIVYGVGVGVLGIFAWVLGDDESTESNATYSKSNPKYDPDPYARPNQKKQNRETKNKNRKKDNYKPKNNRRDGKPAPPKHHTPGHDHQKYSQSRKKKKRKKRKKRKTAKLKKRRKRKKKKIRTPKIPLPIMRNPLLMIRPTARSLTKIIIPTRTKTRPTARMKPGTAM